MWPKADVPPLKRGLWFPQTLWSIAPVWQIWGLLPVFVPLEDCNLFDLVIGQFEVSDHGASLLEARRDLEVAHVQQSMTAQLEEMRERDKAEKLALGLMSAQNLYDFYTRGFKVGGFWFTDHTTTHMNNKRQNA